MTEPDNQIDQDFQTAEPFAQQRWRICKSCDHLKLYICTQCSCFMPAKTRLSQANCPIGLWRAEPSQS
jgi:hypothetical protein